MLLKIRKLKENGHSSVEISVHRATTPTCSFAFLILASSVFEVCLDLEI